MKKLLFILMFAGLLPGCAVYRAAQNEGVSVNDIRQCTSDTCFMAKGMQVMDKKSLGHGQYLVVYRGQMKKSGATYLRAAGHGALDVATAGLWEIAGTPIEGALSNNRGFIIAKATYRDSQERQLVRLEIYDNNGRRVV